MISREKGGVKLRGASSPGRLWGFDSRPGEESPCLFASGRQECNSTLDRVSIDCMTAMW